MRNNKEMQRGRLCMVVPTKAAVEAGLVRGGHNFLSMEEVGGFQLVSNFIEAEGRFRQREDEDDVENNPKYLQPIIYAMAIKGDKFLVYQRDVTGKHSDNRLTGKISAGIGGHIKPVDMGKGGTLINSLWRELGEETIVKRGNRSVSKGSLKRELELLPIGLIKDDDDVGSVHLGIACLLESRRKETEIKLRVGEGEEAAKCEYMTVGEYDQMVSKGEVIPEGWTKIVVDKILRFRWRK